jgi:hypothetical protein
LFFIIVVYFVSANLSNRIDELPNALFSAKHNREQTPPNLMINCANKSAAVPDTNAQIPDWNKYLSNRDQTHEPRKRKKTSAPTVRDSVEFTR